MLRKLCPAVLSQLGDPVRKIRARSMVSTCDSDLRAEGRSAQVLCAACHASPFFQAVLRVPVLLLAEHKVLCAPGSSVSVPPRFLDSAIGGRTIVVLAVRAEEEGGALERRRAHAELVDVRHVARHGRRTASRFSTALSSRRRAETERTLCTPLSANCRPINGIVSEPCEAAQNVSSGPHRAHSTHRHIERARWASVLRLRK